MYTSELVSYFDDECELEGFVAYPTTEKRPLVLLCHAWRGRDEFICQKVCQIAALGYVGFAIDMYGRGIIGKSKEENAALKKPFMDDRTLLQKRVVAGFRKATSLPYVDAEKSAVLGFGFGGVCALDLARTGMPLKGAISIYGHFDPPPFPQSINTKILILHGYDDPIVTQADLMRFQQEMNTLGVDWQVQLYGGTMHAFVAPGINDPASGLLYNPLSAARAWNCATHFLEEVFA